MRKVQLYYWVLNYTDEKSKEHAAIAFKDKEAALKWIKENIEGTRHILSHEIVYLPAVKEKTIFKDGLDINVGTTLESKTVFEDDQSIDTWKTFKERHKGRLDDWKVKNLGKVDGTPVWMLMAVNGDPNTPSYIERRTPRIHKSKSAEIPNFESIVKRAIKLRDCKPLKGKLNIEAKDGELSLKLEDKEGDSLGKEQEKGRSISWHELRTQARALRRLLKRIDTTQEEGLVGYRRVLKEAQGHISKLEHIGEVMLTQTILKTLEPDDD